MTENNWLSPENLDPGKLALELAKAVGRWEAFQNYAKRNYDWISRGETQIAVFGAGGTGKTTFSKVITSEDPLNVDTAYRTDIVQKNVEFPGAISAKLLVTPGQERFVDEVWPSVFESMEKRRSLAVVNLVGYGYHHFELQSFSDFSIYEDGMSPEEFLSKYLEERRQVELQSLDAVKDGMEKVQADVWMLTVVAKQDLWWDERIDVIEHYTGDQREGYASKIEDIKASMNARGLSFSHHYVGVSQVLSNFLGPDGDPLKRTCAGYDLDEHRKYLYNYFRRFNDLLEGKKL